VRRWPPPRTERWPVLESSGNGVTGKREREGAEKGKEGLISSCSSLVATPTPWAIQNELKTPSGSTAARPHALHHLRRSLISPANTRPATPRGS
jgi:hypothetical protein